MKELDYMLCSMLYQSDYIVGLLTTNASVCLTLNTTNQSSAAGDLGALVAFFSGELQLWAYSN